jgi:predicted RNA binding protein YcfA (HicA-like mRNA interferase family)
LSKLAPVSRGELIRRLKKLGFEGPYPGRPHPYMKKGSLVLTIPNPHREDISVDLISKILKRGKIDREEWLSAT